MKIRLKEKGIWSDTRKEIGAKIDDIMIKEDILHPESEKTLIFFREGKHSGLLELSRHETDALLNSLKNRIKLVKSKKLALK